MPKFAVLNVDGDPEKLRERERLLASAGLFVLNATSGPEALDLAQEHVLALAILSGELAISRGYELCRSLKNKTNPPVRVVHISKCGNSGHDHVLALENGADSYLSEPVPPALLIATVHSLVRSWNSIIHSRWPLNQDAMPNDSTQDTERALRFSEEQRLLAVEAADMGTWFYELRSQKLIWDARCYVVFGVEPFTPLSYNRFLDCLHPEDRERTDAAVQEAISTRSGYNIEYRVVHPTGEVRWVAAKGRATVSGNGLPDGMQGIAVDITERKRAEERLQQLNDELKRSNLDFQEFVYAISHDLQEPLRMVYNFVRLIDKRYAADLPEEGREFFHFILDGAQKMDRMIRDLLSYSRVVHDKSKFEEVELRAALLWATSNLDDTIQASGARITYAELPTVNGDFVRLSQLFENLLSNAIKYRGDAAPRVHVQVEPSSEQWIIAVRDNGAGMDPNYANRAFGVFKRLHGKQYPGTGVGLAICKRIVERHGGRIWVETSPGAGSTFFFTLSRAGC